MLLRSHHSEFAESWALQSVTRASTPMVAIVKPSFLECKPKTRKLQGMHRWNLSQRADGHCFHLEITLHKSSEFHPTVFIHGLPCDTPSQHQLDNAPSEHSRRHETRRPHILRCQAANAARRHPHVALSANHQSHYYGVPSCYSS